MIAHVGTLRDRRDKNHYYRYEALAQRTGVTLFGHGLPRNKPGMPSEMQSMSRVKQLGRNSLFMVAIFAIPASHRYANRIIDISRRFKEL
ncbi:MAG: hypothetical protein JWM11_4099 [Planctomycetaceae bacterium]|nr:hypothetical protein [Planctomycetaceae bacterium]